MATLERIRQRSGLLIIVIGFAMMAFILTDLLGSGGVLFNDTSSIGKVNGSKISREEFASRIEELKATNPQYAQLTSKQLADFVWNNLLREKIMGKEFKTLGFVVTEDELFFEIKKNEQIRQAFTNPNTGIFDESQLRQYIRNISEQRETDREAAEMWQQWIGFEKGMREQTQVMKYNKAVEKGFYNPKALAQKDFFASNQTYEMQFVQLTYAAIADSTIAVTDNELRAYIKANKNKFKQLNARNIEFVNFPIAASAEDKEEARQELIALLTDKERFNTTLNETEVILGFANANDDSSFVANNSDASVDMSFHLAGELNMNIDTVFFKSPVGTIVGPYEEEGAYVISKLSEVKNVPDSVKARHILIAFQGAERAGENVLRSGQDAKALADSLFEAVKNDLSLFESTSQIFNDDITAASKGGDLGWFTPGSMAGPFNDYCFYNKKGDVGLVFTNFGFHIIHIVDQQGANKGVRVSSIYRDVIPSDATIRKIYTQASTFASEAQRSDDFRKLAEEKGLMLRPATNIQEFEDNIPGLGSSRKIVRWAWDKERKEGEIGLLENDGQGYVVVVLTDVLKEGTAPLEKVRDAATIAVRNQKKGVMLVKQMEEAKSAGDINAIAAKLNTNVKTQSLNRKSVALTGAGAEPKVIGMMVGSPIGALSGPVAGEAAAYIFVVTSIGEAYDKGEYTDEMNNFKYEMQGRVPSDTFESMKKASKIQDRRALFY
jgi:peptidyl-prolyl cis-trans isomerase D